MVNIPQEPAIAARDEKAVEIFRHQWQVYRKVLDHDYLWNAGAYARLHRFLLEDIARPFDFLDLACGDASGIVPALKDTAVARYQGVDLAAPALALAERNLEALPCDVELEHADFATAMRRRSRPADIVWISLSLHHLETADKRTLMAEIGNGMAGSGALLVYEPTREEGEGRPAYLDRIEEVGRRDWTALSRDEFREAIAHVRTCDLPETGTGWVALGREAGFSRIAELYRSPDDLFRLFCYRP